MTEKEVLWRAMVEHEKTPWIPNYVDCVAGIGGAAETWENGPAGGGFDGFGVRWQGSESAAGAGIPMGDVIAVKDVTRWKEQLRLPDLDAIDWKGLAEQWLAGVDRERHWVCYNAYNAQFERLTHLMGIMDGLCALSEEPEACAEMLHAITDYRLAALERIHDYFHPDLYTPFDDLATHHTLFVSPAVYRALILPEHRRVNDACRALGIVPILHCCGKCEALIPDFIDAGFAGWCSAQPMNDIAGILRAYGDRFSVVGGFDSNGFPGTAEAGDDAVEAEVDRCLREYGGQGSYVFMGFRMSGPGLTREQANAPVRRAYARYRAALG